jgi:putative ABC transport system substrate-binding protein
MPIASLLIPFVSGSSLAQQSPAGMRVYRVGILDWSTAEYRKAQDDALLEALRELGYSPGHNLALDFAFADQSSERATALARELVARGVDVIVTRATPAGHAAKDATQTIPIVLATAADPVGTGLVESLARPGGNVTGVSLMMPDLAAKRLEILREAVLANGPGGPIAFLGSSRDPATTRFIHESQQAARAIGNEVKPFVVANSDELEAAFAAMRDAGVAAVIVQPLFLKDAARIAELAKRARLPTISDLSSAARAGYLISYGPDSVDAQRRAAIFVDKILKGVAPGDLPIEQPARFGLVVNLRTARALGVTIPNSIVARADEVIE